MNTLAPVWAHPGTQQLKMCSETTNEGREACRGGPREEAERSEEGGKEAGDHG
jgi:hypothetical protein